MLLFEPTLVRYPFASNLSNIKDTGAVINGLLCGIIVDLELNFPFVVKTWFFPHFINVPKNLELFDPCLMLRFKSLHLNLRVDCR
jgi:hypothetical protein